MWQNIHARMERKDYLKIRVVITMIMLFCLAGCQAKNITDMGKTKDHESAGKTGNHASTETGNNEIPELEGMLKLAIVCEEIGGS